MQENDYDDRSANTNRQTRRPVQDDTSVVRPPVGRSSNYRPQSRQTASSYHPQGNAPYGRTAPTPYPPQQPYGEAAGTPGQTGGYQASAPYPPQQPYAGASTPGQTGGYQASAPYQPQQPYGGTAGTPGQAGGYQASAPYPPQQPYGGTAGTPGQTGGYQAPAPYPPEPSQPYGGNPYWQPSAPYQPQQTGGMPVQPSGVYTPPEEVQEPDPFGEPGVDPELKKQRSKNLTRKKGGFWEALPEEKAKRRKQNIRSFVLAVLILCVACAVLYYGVFRVRTVQVVGNSHVPAETVISLSGVQLGDSSLNVDTDEAKRLINSNRYLIFQSMDCELMGTVTIYVKERTPAAVMNYCGINYTIDRKGVVLEESEDVSALSDLPQISGMDISGQFGCVVGRTITVNNSAQLTAMRELLVELKVLKAEGEVTKIKMSDLSHILLETREGYSVSLGGSTQIHAKLKSMLAIKNKLNTMEVGTGTIDVSDPESPTFLPESE